MSVDLLDIGYVRDTGVDIAERLFPRPKEDGRQPVPMPVSLRYRPAEGIDYIVLFVPERYIQWVGEVAPDVQVSVVRVIWGDFAFTIDLAFGKEPEIPDLGDAERETEALTALLRAVTGVL